MICVPSVMILAIILESIPWCYLVVGILFLGFWTRDSLYLNHVDSVASSFRILVTFAVVLEVRGILFFQIPWTTYGRSSSLNWNITTGLFLMSSPLYIVWLCQFYFSAWVIRKKHVEFVRHAKPCIHNSENHMFLEFTLLSCIQTPVYQLIVRNSWHSCSSMHIILVVRQAILSWMTWRNKLQYLIHI